MEQKISNLVFWQVSPSIHQASLIVEIDRILVDVEVCCVFMGQVSQERLDLGWSLPDYGDIKLEFCDSKNKLDSLYDTFVGNSVHIFSNVVNNSLVHYVYKKSVNDADAKIGLLSEGFNKRGIKGLLRVLRRKFRDRFILRDLDFVLAIGSNAYEWYGLCGISANKLYPFPYVVDTFEQENISCNDKLVEMIFVGRLCARKNVDTLLNALAELETSAWRLRVIGSGEDEGSLKELSSELAIHQNVEFLGALNYADVIDHIANADFLVLPSLFDGWGAVVNEALSQGTPVLCSNDCGAKDLIVCGWSGDLFEAKSISALAELLYNYIQRGPVPLSKRREIQRYYRCISASEISQYFIKILNHLDVAKDEIKPMPPWYGKKKLSKF